MKSILTFGRLNLVMILIGILLLLTGCSGKDRPYNQTLVLTVDDSKVYLDEMMYHIMLEEMYGQLYADYTASTEDYWNKKDENGITIKEAAKEVVIENAIRYELLYLLATEQEYILTEEEKDIAIRQANNIRISVQPDSLEATQLTDDKLLAIQEKILIATNFFEDYLVELEIDEQSIRNRINTDEYKQYDIEYIFGTKQQYKEISDLLENIDISKDFTMLAKNIGLNSGELSFLEGKDTFGDEENLEKAIIDMEEGQVSEIIETVKGYYIIKLNDNSSSSLYNEAVKEAMNTAITEIFKPAYEDLKKTHKIKIKKNTWKKIELGTETIPKA